jgi:hypothetical protein
MIIFEDVYPWLNIYETSHISPSSASLISQVSKALGEHNAIEARGLLQQLYDLAYKLRDEKEVAELLVECAHSSYILGDLADAEKILEEAVSRTWSDLHQRAVIQWMLGCVQWNSLPDRQKAIVSWRNSLADFERLARQPGLSFEQHAWYQETSSRLQKSLLEDLEMVGSYMDVGPDQSLHYAEGESQPPDDAALYIPSLTESAIPAPSDILQLFSISEEIPAGDFGPSGIDPFPIGMVEIEQLSINGHPYSIHSTRGRKIINLPIDQKFFVVKVKGDSMDQENITEQDYVILRKVDRPSNGDIVMAEVVGIDSHATLKIFSRMKDAITLKPHSSNPSHKPFVFTNANEGFYIRGVVVAVLKPVL